MMFYEWLKYSRPPIVQRNGPRNNKRGTQSLISYNTGLGNLTSHLIKPTLYSLSDIISLEHILLFQQTLAWINRHTVINAEIPGTDSHPM